MARKNAVRGRRLFEEDAEKGVFRASIEKPERHVILYPRKSRRGFVYCVWKPGVLSIGLDAIIDGGVAEAKSLEGAAIEAVEALLGNIG